MFDSIFGSTSAEQVLTYISARGSGYGREIAIYFKASQTAIRRQLDRLEASGVIYGENQGKTRVYYLNPRYSVFNELKALLDRMLDFYPVEVAQDLKMNRRRPRRQSKPL